MEEVKEGGDDDQVSASIAIESAAKDLESAFARVMSQFVAAIKSRDFKSGR